MKLIVTVVQDKDAPRFISELVKKGFRATKLASTGGFLKEGNTTLLTGVEDGQVEEVLALVKATCRSREQLVTPVNTSGGAVDAYIPYPVEVVVGGATVFVLDVERHVRI